MHKLENIIGDYHSFLNQLLYEMREAGFELPSCSVKFHLLSLPTAVYLQQKLGLTDIRDGQ